MKCVRGRVNIAVVVVVVVSGTEGLLWSPHVWTAVKSRSLHPHQLDGPRRKRLLLILQCLRTHFASVKNKTQMEDQDGGQVICERGRRISHSIFQTTSATHHSHLNQTFYSSCCCSFIYQWEEIIYAVNSTPRVFSCSHFYHSNNRSNTLMIPSGCCSQYACDQANTQLSCWAQGSQCQHWIKVKHCTVLC